MAIMRTLVISISFLFAQNDIEFGIFDLSNCRDVIVILAPEITEISLLERVIAASDLHSEVAAHNGLLDIDSSALEVGEDSFHDSIFFDG